MIINSPRRIDFEAVAKENLCQAFILLYNVYENYIEYDDEIVEQEVSINDIWKHNNGTIRTALILLYQSIEGLMKSVICETSPLLLIDKPRKDWPTLPMSDNKDFDSLYTIGGESLLTTFCAVNSNIEINSSLITFIEDVRQKRNQVIHGTNITSVTPNYIIENVLKTFTLWFGKDAWHINLKRNVIENPLFGYLDSDLEGSLSYRYLDFALDIIGKSSLSKHISFNIKGHQYFCPKCKSEIDGDYDSLESKWAFLNPNAPTSNNLTCANCYQNFKIIRDKCNRKACNGNVLYDDNENTGELICLTCYAAQ